MGAADYGRITPGPGSTAHLTEHQRKACQAVSQFYAQTEQEVRFLLSIWIDRDKLNDDDKRAIVRELVDWRGSYTRPEVAP